MVSREFLLAGDAIFTIEVPEPFRSGNPHYTWRIQKVEASLRWPESYFVKLLTGPDNNSDYTYVGKLDIFSGQVETTRKSTMTANSYAVKLVNRILARVWVDDHSAYTQYGFQTHHEGRCGRCARRLTVPESIESGIGPECIKKMAGV